MLAQTPRAKNAVLQDENGAGNHGKLIWIQAREHSSWVVPNREIPDASLLIGNPPIQRALLQVNMKPNNPPCASNVMQIPWM